TGGGPDLVGAPGLEQVARDITKPDVRAVELVRRTNQNVGTCGGDLDRSVRGVVDGVDPGERSGLVRELGDTRDVHERPDGVRRPRKGDHSRALGELLGEIVEIERSVVADVREADDEAEVARELE